MIVIFDNHFDDLSGDIYRSGKQFMILLHLATFGKLRENKNDMEEDERGEWNGRNKYVLLFFIAEVQNK